MSLRIKLLLAFLAFSVLPLSAVVFYSYTTSTRAFRKVMEAEAMAMTEEMERELGKVKQELHSQLNQFCEIPFKEITGQPSIRKELGQNPDWQNFIKNLPANEYALEALEFIPQPPPPPVTPHLSPHGQPKPQPESNTPMAEDESDRLIIYMEKGSDASAVSRPSTTSHSPTGTQGSVESTPPKPPAPPSPVNETDSNHMPRGIEQQIFQAAEQVRVAKEMARQQEKFWKHKTGYYRQLSEQQKKDLDEKKHMMHLLLGRGFTSEVRDSGKVVGTVSAQVDSQKILDRILQRTYHSPDEIPFAIDVEGKIYTSDAADLEKLQTIPLTKAYQSKGQAENLSPVMKNWVVIIRQDPSSGLIIGIARPIRAPLEEIRSTSTRNLLYGLGIIGLSMVGTLPLSGRLTQNLRVLTHYAEELGKGHMESQVPISSRDEIGCLAATFNRMAGQLRESQQALLEQERLKKELELCRRIQEELLPRQPLHQGLAEIRGISIPANEVGGDFFNYFPLAKDKIALLIGDVSGKGVPAALLMANIQATLRARLSVDYGLARLVAHLDQEIASSTPAEIYLTLFMGIYDQSQGIFSYVNAGHNTQYALKAGGELDSLESSGRPLGLVPGGEYREGRVQLRPGEALFLYTDGLVEAENEAGEEFGANRLIAFYYGNRSGRGWMPL